jgi:hypothetical protein
MLKLKEMTCLLSRWACVLGLLAAPIVGCSDLDGDSGTGGVGGTGGNSGAGGIGGTGGIGGAGGADTVLALYTILANNPDGDDPPLEGVKVCFDDICALSDSRGRLALEGPTNQEITFTMEKEGYGSWISGGVVGENPFGGSYYNTGPLTFLMYTDAQLEAIAGEQLELDPAYPWEGGIVGLVANTSVGLAGVTFEPVGSTVGEVGQAFYFDAATEQYSIDLEATTSFAQVYTRFPFAEGGFAGVTPGVQQFELSGAIGDCHGPSWGWPGDTANSIRVPVREGFGTYGSMNCDPPAP